MILIFIQQKSQQNRFKVTSKHRALALDRLDSTESENTEREQTTCPLCGLRKHTECASITDNTVNGNGEVVQNISTDAKIINKICECGKINSADGSVASKQKGNIEKTSTDRANSDGKSSDICDNEVETGGVIVSQGDHGDGHIRADNRYFCLVDMEAEHLESSQMLVRQKLLVLVRSWFD